jgi:hypothetical protein
VFSLTCLADDDPGFIDQVQRIFAGCLFGWHVTFLKKSDWQIDKVTFTSKSLIERLHESGAAVT